MLPFVPKSHMRETPVSEELPGPHTACGGANEHPSTGRYASAHLLDCFEVHRSGCCGIKMFTHLFYHPHGTVVRLESFMSL